MADLLTKKTKASVPAFLKRITDTQQRQDAQRLVALMSAATGAKPAMWGTSIVGFGDHHFHYANGRECEWPVVGFAPRKGTLTLYLMSGFEPLAPMLRKLGKHKTSKSCLYIKKLADVDMAILQRLVEASVAHLTKPAKKSRSV